MLATPTAMGGPCAAGGPSDPLPTRVNKKDRPFDLARAMRPTFAAPGARGMRPSAVAAYGVALAALAAAVLLRWLLDPVLGTYLPLVTLFGAVAAAVWFGG